MSQRLLDYFEHNCKQLDQSFELASFLTPPRRSFGALAAGNITTWKSDETLTAVSARAIAGAAAARDWSLVDELVSQIQDKKSSIKVYRRFGKGIEKVLLRSP